MGIVGSIDSSSCPLPPPANPPISRPHRHVLIRTHTHTHTCTMLERPSLCTCCTCFRITYHSYTAVVYYVHTLQLPHVVHMHCTHVPSALLRMSTHRVGSHPYLFCTCTQDGSSSVPDSCLEASSFFCNSMRFSSYLSASFNLVSDIERQVSAISRQADPIICNA